jgi:hypothetical protein
MARGVYVKFPVLIGRGNGDKMAYADTKTLKRLKGLPGKLILLALLAVFPLSASALQVTVVRGDDGSAVSGFKWQVVEDSTHSVDPGVSSDDELSFGIHRSTNRVIANGHAAGATATVSIPNDRRYFVSVLPDVECPVLGGFSCTAAGGAQVKAGQDSVEVVVQRAPIPTAQITVLVFSDTKPLNNAADIPAELHFDPEGEDEQNPAMDGFTIELDDGYARVQQDVFGNLLGTTYVRDANGDALQDAEGQPTVDVPGTGQILTDADGMAVIKNIYPGKYGVNAVAPGNSGWQQTSTIEGKKTIDAWVKADEPPFFQEFGMPDFHASFGFTKEFNLIPTPGFGDTVSTVSGRIVAMHPNRPPYYGFNPAQPIADCWIGLNDMSIGVVPGEAVFVGPCDDASEFSIENVPPGNYRLGIFDKYLNVVFGNLDIIVSAADGATKDLGDIQVFQWFGRQEHYVFFDTNRNGFPDFGELGIPEQGINIRHRDGTIYQSYPTDLLGAVPFDQVFPFFHWTVAEVDFLRFDATGVTVQVDGGGAAEPNSILDAWFPGSSPYFGFLGEVPTDQVMGMQLQPENGNATYRTETGQVLTQATQTFLGSTNRFFWGKSTYLPGQNGGISGVMFYAVTRAEDDPRYAAGEEWEPGVARAVINLYLDENADGVIDDLNGDGHPTLADVDNYPFGWSEGGDPGPEDVDHLFNWTYETGDAIQVTSTDSWDDSMPTGCVGETATQSPYETPTGGTAQDCFEGLRTFNQVRPGVFDGGYAFTDYVPGGVWTGQSAISPIPEGTYIVEGAPPPLFFTVAEEHKNVDFGDLWTPSPLLLPAYCVGDDHVVPALLTLFGNGQPVDAPWAGENRPLCDRKQVVIGGDGTNAAADFFVSTEVPLPGRAVGITMDDLGNEFDLNSPNFGEKFAPPWMPVALYDWTQTTPFSRIYTDEYGAYNALVPATHNVNIPSPSGVSPFMATVCLNDPGPIEDPSNPGQFINDPFYNDSYSRFCYTFNFHSGTTTYLDTPVLPLAAHAGAKQGQLDCQLPEGTPRIRRLDGPGGNSGPVAQEGDDITITSMGSMEVRNPAFGVSGQPLKIWRDFGFGANKGTVRINGKKVKKSDISAWSSTSITLNLSNKMSTGQVTVKRKDNGLETKVGITLTIDPTQTVMTVPVGGSIQDTIDGAPDEALVLVPAGIWNESPIITRNIQLQGFGAGSTFINGTNRPSSRVIEWRERLRAKIESGEAGMLPGQNLDSDEQFGWEWAFAMEDMPGIMVMPADGVFPNGNADRPRIDGFTISNSENAGGILVNGYTNKLEISNNKISSNRGRLAGGIRVGRSDIQGIVDADNRRLWIHNNDISKNSGVQGPGGIALFAGSDRYVVEENWICGNFSQDGGAGIGHIGESNKGTIENNDILFNEAWNGEGEGLAPGSGGGILVAGHENTCEWIDGIVAEADGANCVPQGGDLSPGTGDLLEILANRIQGNSAGTGDGGAIRLQNVSGQDISGPGSPFDSSEWNTVEIFDNIIVNNVAGNAGAISLQDTAKAVIAHNTIANNDSTATTLAALAPDLQSSQARGAGVVSYEHSNDLQDAIVGFPWSDPEFASYSNPRLVNNIIWHNRSFSWDAALGGGIGGLVPPPTNPEYHDLELYNMPSLFLDPENCVLTDLSVPGAGYDDGTNVDGDPEFIDEYVNGPQGLLVETEFNALQGPLQVAVAFDEGWNFIDIAYGPLTLIGDYHIDSNSSGASLGETGILSEFNELNRDFDGDVRPGNGPDIGADEHELTNALCGIGFEVVFIIPALQWGMRRRRKARAQEMECSVEESAQ